MTWFRLLIRGENFPSSTDGNGQLMGFYTTRFVQAETPESARVPSRHKMQKPLIWSALLCSVSALLSQPTPSPKLPAVLSKQAERAKQGISDLRPFQAELEPLAQSGDAVSQFMLGAQLLESNQPAAISWLRKSADGGCAGAAGLLGTFLLQSSSPEAKQWIQRAAKGGDAMSILMLATFHERGEQGFPKSIEHAVAYYELALRQSYSKPLSDQVADRIKKLHSTLEPQQLKASQVIQTRLFLEYPKIPNYLGGQSLP